VGCRNNPKYDTRPSLDKLGVFLAHNKQHLDASIRLGFSTTDSEPSSEEDSNSY